MMLAVVMEWTQAQLRIHKVTGRAVFDGGNTLVHQICHSTS
jgi:hypothetical protein